MATTKARVDDATTEKNKVHLGASGGLAPEGYGTPLFGHREELVDGVVERGHEGDHNRFVEAEKFQRSKVEFAKKEKQAKKDLAEGKDTNPVKEAVADQQKKQDEIAAKKPTAAGANTNLDSPAVAQSAKETVKDEAKEVAAAAKENPKK